MVSKVNDLINKLVGQTGSLLAAMGSIRDEVPNMKDDFNDAIDSMKSKVGELVRQLENAIAKARYLNQLTGAHWTSPADVAGTTYLPTAPIPAFATAGTTNNVNLTFGPTTINNGMDQARFEGRVRQTVRDAMRGI
jgi:hypothetical protein